MGGTNCTCSDDCNKVSGTPITADLAAVQQASARIPQESLAEHLARQLAAQDAGRGITTVLLSSARCPPPESPAEPEAEAFVTAPPAPAPELKQVAPEPLAAPGPVDEGVKVVEVVEDVDGVLRFQATLPGRSDGHLGFDHIQAEDGSDTLLVTDISFEASRVAAWNSAQERAGQSNQAVRCGDRITAVHGVSGDRDAMISMLREANVVLEFERWPKLITVVLQRNDPSDKLGIQVELVQKSDGHQVLRVGRIIGGLLGDWNQKALQAKRFFEAVVPGSEIESVGDLRGNPEKMRDAVVSWNRVELTFQRLDPSVFKRMSVQLRQLKDAIPAAAG